MGRLISLVIILLLSMVSKADSGPVMVFSCQLAPTLPLFQRLDKLYQEGFARLGYQFEMVFQPNVRSVHSASMGHTDGTCFRVAAFADNSKAKNLVRVDSGVAVIEFGVWIAKERMQQLDIPTLLAGDYRIGYIRGAWLIEQMLEKRSNLHLNIGIETPQSGVGMLHGGRIDAYIDHNYQVEDTLSYMANNQLRLLPSSVGFALEEVYPYLNKKHERLVEPLRRALDDILTHPRKSD